MPFSGICIVLKIVVCLQLEAGVVCSGSVFYLFYFYVNPTTIPPGNTVGGGQNMISEHKNIKSNQLLNLFLSYFTPIHNSTRYPAELSGKLSIL